ncbi:hypothetical protein BH09BAC1_BH09BAC1_22470 [soil metagenome]
MVQDYYKTLLPYFDIYDSQGSAIPFHFGPQKYSIVNQGSDTSNESAIDIFLTNGCLYLGSKSIVVNKLADSVDSILRTKEKSAFITLGFEGKVSYADFLEVYAILAQIKSNAPHVGLDYYPLDVYRSLRPNFKIDNY